jgi:hypothetical protein
MEHFSKTNHLQISTGLLSVICLVIILEMLFFGLWPFNYLPKNQVAWVETGKGINFQGKGHILSTESTIWPRDDYSGEPFTLEIILKPERTYDQWIPHILSLCDQSGHEVVYFGQWKNHLIIRLMEYSYRIEKVEMEIEASAVLIAGKPVLINLVLAKGGASLFINGQLDHEFPDFNLTQLMVERPVQSLVFGNSSSGYNPWTGDITYFTVFDKALESTVIRDRYNQLEIGEEADGMISAGEEIIRYRFNENSERIIRNDASEDWKLIIPQALIPLRREFLSLPSMNYLNDRSFINDAIINLLGFMPIGFFLAVLIGTPASSKRVRALAIVVLLGGSLSLFIEVNQAFMISRVSSASDLFVNILGTALGANFMIQSS